MKTEIRPARRRITGIESRIACDRFDWIVGMSLGFAALVVLGIDLWELCK